MAHQNSGSSSSSNDSHQSTNEWISISYHWFYKVDVDGKVIWEPFSKKDSEHVERVYLEQPNGGDVVHTDGGRYDVDINERTRKSVYWTSGVSEVRRCSWFYKGHVDGRFIPYTEPIAAQLETEYRRAHDTSQWHHTVNLPNGEYVIFHGPDILVHFITGAASSANDTDELGDLIVSPGVALTSDAGELQHASSTASTARPRVVKRAAFAELFDIDEAGESERIDHLVFMVHGVGPRCDLKLRSLIHVVNDFRVICQQMIKSHYKTSYRDGVASRIEILPISWHDKLHRDEQTGIDRKLKKISLESIPILRDFTNDTILDALCYTSPIYSQTIITCVISEMNRLHELFRARNPYFRGGVSLAGHSLGSLIIFDILSHQRGQECEDKRQMNKRISCMMIQQSALPRPDSQQPANSPVPVSLHYENLNFEPVACFALGSPISMFLTIRGLDTLGTQFKLPTCPTFLNIFHPYDPVAYRIESLVNPDAAALQPVLIPHHKGRKRMHLELKDTMLRVGTDLKHKFVYSLRSTWNTLYQQFINNDSSIKHTTPSPGSQHEQEREDRTEDGDTAHLKNNIDLGILNQGRRIDYVLQEAPVEFFNEYLFALQSHFCYWESEDTILLILKEIYDSLGITADNQVPQQTMTIRPDDSDDEDSDN